MCVCKEYKKVRGIPRELGKKYTSGRGSMSMRSEQDCKVSDGESVREKSECIRGKSD